MSIRKIIGTIGIIISVILICYGFNIKIPTNSTQTTDINKDYKQGEAYELIIESNLDAKEISNATTKKAFFIVGGCILLVLSATIFAISKTSLSETIFKNFLR